MLWSAWLCVVLPQGILVSCDRKVYHKAIQETMIRVQFLPKYVFWQDIVTWSFPLVILHRLFQLTMAPCSAWRYFLSISFVSVLLLEGNLRYPQPDILTNSCESFGTHPQVHRFLVDRIQNGSNPPALQPLLPFYAFPIWTCTMHAQIS